MRKSSCVTTFFVLTILILLLAFTLSACQKTEIYHIDFYADGVLIYSSESTDIKKISFPESPQKNGYVFVEWQNENGMKTSKNNLYGSAFVNGRLSLYAVFSCAHADYTEISCVEATCTLGGKSYRHCNVCLSDFETTISKLGHDYSTVLFDDDYHWGVCSRCSFESEKKKHSLSWTVSTLGDCNTKEVKTAKCASCAVVLTCEASEVSHSYGKYTFDDGYHYRTCKNCNAVSKDRHSYEKDTCVCSFSTRREATSGTALTKISKNIPIDSDFDNTATNSGDTLEMITVDVGQGDCIFFKFPDGTTMLMDAGSADVGTSRFKKIKNVLSAYSVTTIDYLFATHFDYDHVRNLDKVLQEYEVKNVYIPKVPDNMSKSWQDVIKAISKETYTKSDGSTAQAIVRYNVGDYEISGAGWRMRCYSYLEQDYPIITTQEAYYPHPSDLDLTADHADVTNAISPICFLEYSGRTIVLTGDSNVFNEKYLLERGVLNTDCDVLKVAHHGSKTSTTAEFLQAISVEYAIISYGTNVYGHPTDEVLSRLDGCIIYETKKQGNVLVKVSGNGSLGVFAEK